MKQVLHVEGGCEHHSSYKALENHARNLTVDHQTRQQELHTIYTPVSHLIHLVLNRLHEISANPLL